MMYQEDSYEMRGYHFGDLDETDNKIIAILHDWHTALEEGTANSRYPGNVSVSQEDADKIIDILDRYSRAEFEQNMGWHRQKGTEAPWDFARLLPHARLAMTEEIKRALNTEGQIL